jgi:hypothetical protein
MAIPKNDEADTNNLLARHGINVKGADERVDVRWKAIHNEVAIIFTGVQTLGAMQEAADRLRLAIPERLGKTLNFGETGGEFTVAMPVGTYEQLTGNRFDRGKVPNL